MPTLFQILAKLPVPAETRLKWQRSLLNRACAKEIAEAQKLKDENKLESLEGSYRYEADIHDEEDAYITKKLTTRACRLRVPIPHRLNEDDIESQHWYEGHYTGGWYLTTRGVAALREEIRRELKARHEARSHWAVWFSAFTGVVGALTGLVALITRAWS